MKNSVICTKDPFCFKFDDCVWTTNISQALVTLSVNAHMVPSQCNYFVLDNDLSFAELCRMIRRKVGLLILHYCRQLCSSFPLSSKKFSTLKNSNRLKSETIISLCWEGLSNRITTSKGRLSDRITTARTPHSLKWNLWNRELWEMLQYV